GRVMSGADDFAEGGRGGDVYGHSGSLVVAIDPGIFRDRAAFEQGVDETLAKVKAVPPAPGFDEVLVPGEPESRTREQRQREGIPIPHATWEAVRAVAAELGVDAA